MNLMKLIPKEKQTENINIRVSAEFKARIAKAATHYRVTPSEFIKAAIDQALTETEKKSKKS